MVDLAQLVAALERSTEVDEWIATAGRNRRIQRMVGAGRLRRMVEKTELGGTVFRDLRRGRGSARFRATGDDDATELVQSSAALAAESVGPPWRLPPPSAPARVEVADEAAFADPDHAVDAVTDALLGAVGAAGVATTRLSIELAAGERDLRTSAGLARGYRHTGFAVDAMMILRPGATVAQPIHLRARRAADLAINTEIAAAAQLLTDRGRAAALPPGPCDVLLTGAALASPAEPGYGLWQPLIAQANATAARRGLSRYRTGQSIYGTAVPTGETITVRSDGTIAYGLRSAPLGPLGEPVRPFDLIRGGVASGRPLDLVEAALAGVAANGGARNLIIENGTSPIGALSRPEKRRLVEIVDVGFVDVDPATGDFAISVRLGYRGDNRQPVAGNLVRGNLFDALLRARFSRETTVRGWYYGPAGVRLDGLELA